MRIGLSQATDRPAPAFLGTTGVPRDFLAMAKKKTASTGGKKKKRPATPRGRSAKKPARPGARSRKKSTTSKRKTLRSTAAKRKPLRKTMSKLTSAASRARTRLRKLIGRD